MTLTPKIKLNALKIYLETLNQKEVNRQLGIVDVHRAIYYAISFMAEKCSLQIPRDNDTRIGFFIDTEMRERLLSLVNLELENGDLHPPKSLDREEKIAQMVFEIHANRMAVKAKMETLDDSIIKLEKFLKA